MVKEKALKMTSTLLFLSAIYFFIKVGFIVLMLAFIFGGVNYPGMMTTDPTSIQFLMMSGFVKYFQAGNIFPTIVNSLVFLAGGILLVIASKKIKMALNTFVWSLVSLITLMVMIEFAYFNTIVLYIGIFASLVTLYFADRK